MKWALAAGWSLTLATAVLAQPASAPPQPANLKPANLKPVGPKPSQLPTPVDQRAVEIVALDKLSGHSQILALKPGESVTFRELRIAVRTCETRAPGLPPESGAFVQITGGGKRLFSGWMFAVARSLNAFEHPGYAVWVKSCKMRFPDSGPDTVSARSSAPPRASSATPAANTPEAAPAEGE